MINDPLKISGMHDGAKPIIFENAATLRESLTDAEKIIWEYFKSKPHGFKLRRQHPINQFILDFYCHKARLSIELDGAHHREENQKMRDSERTTYLGSVGIKEIRFWNSEVLKHPEKVISEIERNLITGSPL